MARRTNKKKTPEMIKRELLASILELSDGEENYSELSKEVKKAKEPKDGIALLKKYEDHLKGANKKIINIVGKQGKLLKKFRDDEEFFDRVGLSRSNIYSLYKFIRKFPLSKNSTLTSSYFKNNFRAIKKDCKANLNIFGKKN